MPDETPIDIDALKQQELLSSQGAGVERTESDPVAPFTAQLTAREKEIQEQQNRYLRLQAEFSNYKTRSEKEKTELYKAVVERVIAGILPALDSFDRATNGYDQSHSAEDMYKGLLLIQKQFEDALAGLGVKRMQCVGVPFDPHLHEALLHQEDASNPEHTVVGICQNGYVYGDKVIRHAQVVVSKQAEAIPDSAPPPENTENIDG